jgi:hypothetical protein
MSFEQLAGGCDRIACACHGEDVAFSEPFVRRRDDRRGSRGAMCDREDRRAGLTAKRELRERLADGHAAGDHRDRNRLSEPFEDRADLRRGGDRFSRGAALARERFDDHLRPRPNVSFEIERRPPEKNAEERDEEKENERTLETA